MLLIQLFCRGTAAAVLKQQKKKKKEKFEKRRKKKNDFGILIKHVVRSTNRVVRIPKKANTTLAVMVENPGMVVGLAGARS